MAGEENGKNKKDGTVLCSVGLWGVEGRKNWGRGRRRA